MDSFAVVLLVSLTLVALATICIVAVRRRRGEVGVRSSLELIPQDGWSLLNLAMVNRHDSKVWIERAAFILEDMDADMQSGPAFGKGSIDVREFVPSNEALRISLIEAVYNAAGKPQGVYTFRLSAAVRYRLGERWLESETAPYQVDMVRLSSIRLRRTRVRANAIPSGKGALSAQGLLVPPAVIPSVEESRSSTTENFKGSLHSV